MDISQKGQWYSSANFDNRMYEKCSNLYDKVINFRTNVIENWKVELAAGRSTIKEVKIQRGIFQVDSFLPLVCIDVLQLYTGWNDKIVALEKTTWFHFHLMKTGFLFFFFSSFFFFFFFFFVADHLLGGQLCTNPKSDKSLLSCLKVTQCPTGEIGVAPQYNSFSLPIQVMTTGPLPAPSKCKSGLPRITGTCPVWWKQSFRLRLWALVGFQVRATSCHLTSSRSAWKSTPKCTWVCWRVWWSPGAIRWPVADPECGSRTRRRPTSPKRPRLGIRRSATTLYPSLPEQQCYKFRLCGVRDETINHIISECSKVAQREYKTRHDWVGKIIHWEWCKRLKFNHANNRYMHNPESVRLKETHKTLWGFEIKMDHRILDRESNLVLLRKEKMLIISWILLSSESLSGN